MKCICAMLRAAVTAWRTYTFTTATRTTTTTSWKCCLWAGFGAGSGACTGGTTRGLVGFSVCLAKGVLLTPSRGHYKSCLRVTDQRRANIANYDSAPPGQATHGETTASQEVMGTGTRLHAATCRPGTLSSLCGGMAFANQGATHMAALALQASISRAD